VRRHRRDIRIDLIEQVRKFGDIADIIRPQFHRHDFMRVGIHSEMQLAPSPTRSDTVFLVEPLTFAINLEAGTVDKKTQRLIPFDVLRQYRQTAAATAEVV
jgi:hypothetical protein